MSRRRRWFRNLFVVTLVCITCTLGVGAALLHTTLGAKWLLSSLTAKISAQVDKGTLAGPLVLTNVVVDAKNPININRVAIDWSPMALWQGRVEAAKIDVDAITVKTNTVDDAQPLAFLDQFRQALNDFALPIDLSIAQITIRQVTIDKAQRHNLQFTQVDIKSFNLSDAVVSITNATTTIETTRLRLWGRADLAPEGQVQLNVQWHSDFLGVHRPLAGDGSVVGSWQALQIEHTLTDPVTQLSKGRVSNLRAGELTWQLEATLPAADISRPLNVKAPLVASTQLSVTGNDTQFSVRGDARAVWQGHSININSLNVLVSEDQVEIEQLNASTPLGDIVATAKAATDPARPWHATLEFQDLSLESVDKARHSAYGKTFLGGLIDFDGVGTTTTAKVNLQTQSPVMTPWRITGTLKHADGQINAEQLRFLNQTHDDQQLLVDATIDASTADLSRSPVTVNAAWNALQWPVLPQSLDEQDRSRVEPLVVLDAGRLNVQGHVDKYDYSLTTNYLLPNRLQGAAKVNGRGNTQGLVAHSVNAIVAGGEVVGQGELSWVDGVDWRTQLQLSALNPGVVDPRWDGEIYANLTANGKATNDSLSHSFLLTELTGRLLGAPLTGRLDVSLHENVWTLTDAHLQSGSSIVRLDGSIGEAQALRWQADSSDLGSVHPDAGGQLTLQGTVEGPLPSPRIKGRLRAQDLRFRQQQVELATAEFDVDLAGQLPWAATLNAQSVQMSDQLQLNQVAATVLGDADRHKVTIKAQNNTYGKVSLTGHGQWQHPDWRLVTDNVLVVPQDRPEWKQVKPWRIGVSGTDISLPAACLSEQDQSLCASLNKTSKKIDADLKLAGFELSTLNSTFETQNIDVNGVVNANVSGTVNAQGVSSFKGDLSLDRVVLGYLDGARTRHSMVVKNIEASVRQQDKLSMAIVGEFGAGGDFKANLKIDERFVDALERDAVLAGDMALAVPDLSALSIPGLSDYESEGNLELKGRVTGTAADPKLSLLTRIRDGALTLPQTGARLSNIEVDAQTIDAQTVDVRARFNASDEPMTIAGQARLHDIGHATAQFNIRGERVPIVSLPEALVEASPDLSVTIKERIIETTGVLRIDHAEILLDANAPAVSVSNDVTIESKTPNGSVVQSTTKPRRLRSRITLELGEDARINAAGFVGRLSGSPIIIDKGDGLITALGDINVVDGEYTLFGQTLPIESGRFSYADTDIRNPLIDLAASRKVEDVVARVRVTGSAVNPIVNFESQPPMQDGDVISYLLFQRPVAALSSSDALALVKFAASLRRNEKRKSPVTDKIAAALGLPDLQFAVNSTQAQTAVVVGSQLSSRFYLGYAIGLFDTASRLLLRYKLTDNLSVQSELGASSGADLQYSHER